MFENMKSISSEMVLARRMIIAFCGRRRVGKDEAAMYLSDRYAMKHIKISARLKQACRVMFGFTAQQVEDEKDAVDGKWGVSPRQVMQFIGTDVMQFKIQEIMPNVERSFWVKSLCCELEKAYKQDNVVISDVRFEHEVQELRCHGAMIVKIVRQPREASAGNIDNHVSETESDVIIADYMITNNNSLEDFHNAVEEVFKKILQEENGKEIKK
jgi:hypothetical protein